MSPNPVVCPNMSLPRDIDVEIQLSRPQAEIATDMTLLCFLTPDSDLPPNNGRVRYYSSLTALGADYDIGSPAYFAGSAFFSRSVRPLTMAVARVFEDPVPAGLVAGDIDFTALEAITDGAFNVQINGADTAVTGIDFTGATTLTQIVAALNRALTNSGTPQLIASEKYGSMALETIVSGDNITLTYATTPATGTDVSALLGLTYATGAQLWQGYTPTGLAAEAALVRQASICNGRPIYGWTVDAVYRDTQAQKDFADWIEPLAPAIFMGCTNSDSAFNAGVFTNFGTYIHDKGYTRSAAIWHNNPQVYPEVSYLALALSVNYSLTNSAITMKFKELDGIEPGGVDETMLAVFNSRNINCYTRVGNNSRTVREGTQGADTWYTDSRVNLDNFREELQVEVFNAFLRNPKIPYTSAGQDILVSACSKICAKYVRNGVFADRDIEAPQLESGFSTAPAYQITPVPVAFATTSERAARIAPPIQIVAYEAGAFHRVTIRVDVYN